MPSIGCIQLSIEIIFQKISKGWKYEKDDWNL